MPKQTVSGLTTLPVMVLLIVSGNPRTREKDSHPTCKISNRVVGSKKTMKPSVTGTRPVRRSGPRKV